LIRYTPPNQRIRQRLDKVDNSRAVFQQALSQITTFLGHRLPPFGFDFCVLRFAL
jgi:hypothetical protein